MEAFDVLNMGNIFIWTTLTAIFFTPGPLYKSEKNSSDYRVHGTQNDWLELTVSTQKSVLKSMHRVLRY